MLSLKVHFPLSRGPAELSKGNRDTRGSSTPGYLAAHCRWVKRSCRTDNRKRKERGEQEQGKKSYIYRLSSFPRKIAAAGGGNSNIFMLQERKMVS